MKATLGCPLPYAAPRAYATHIDLIVALVPVHDGLVRVDLTLEGHVLLEVAVHVLGQVTDELEVGVSRWKSGLVKF